MNIKKITLIAFLSMMAFGCQKENHVESSIMSLAETEDYIKSNGHLPGVPSASEIEEDGLSLGEMNRLLMQKVEELTLHIIELQKQVDELKNQQK